MDIIIHLADKFSKLFIRDGSTPNELIEEAKIEVGKIYDPLDKIKFLQFVIEKNRESQEEHFKDCKQRENCVRLINHKKIDYFLCQELKMLGTHKFEDTFSNFEIKEYNEKIYKILSDIEVLKDGQKIIYEDLSEQLNELKDLYFLGKKKWYQIVVGKVIEMASSGIISQTISKEIIEQINEVSKYLSHQ